MSSPWNNERTPIPDVPPDGHDTVIRWLDGNHRVTLTEYLEWLERRLRDAGVLPDA